MKHKSTVYVLILLFTTCIGYLTIPSLVKTATYSPDDYPFMYYSSILKELCLVDFSDSEHPLRDIKGNTYDKAQFDTLLPLLNFRQLMMDGRLPKKIDGEEITMPKIRTKSIIHRHEPRNFFTPELGLYIMYEAMPKRVDTDTPDDVFRFTDRIEFIDIASNSVKQRKSGIFQKALLEEGYTFPAQWISGNMSPLKAYDEGYFSLDAQGRFFHIKMVNGRPYVKDTKLSEQINIDRFVMIEMGDKRFYGFLYDKSGNIYIIEAGGGTYKPVRLEIDPFDIRTDQLVIMGNLLYWTVTVTKPTGQSCYGLKTETLERITEYHIEREPGKWDIAAKWLFPVIVTAEHKQTDFIYPVFHFTGYNAFILNFVLAILIFLTVPNTPKKKVFNSVYILLTGIVGLIALMVLPGFKKKTKA